MSKQNNFSKLHQNVYLVDYPYLIQLIETLHLML